ncbi:MAG: hypothetical protein IKT08_04855 [Bacteroidales bacterium]|nr:hypothetical protein [Bacteroidales bacterium]
MKKLSIFLGSLLIAVAILAVSCGKDKETTIQKFINIVDAVLVSDDMPTATADYDIDVQMGGNVIPGGSAYVRVSSPIQAQKIYVAVNNQVGYYEVPADNNNRDFSYNFVMIVDQGIDLGEDGIFTIQVAILDIDGNVSNIWENNIGLITVGTGELQISMTFDQHKDIDLHVIEPEIENDTLTYGDRHIYYGHRTSRNGGKLDLDSNAGCSTSEVWAENVTYGEDAFVRPGLYKVYAVIWSNCDTAEEPTNITLSVFYGGQLIATENGVANPFVATFPGGSPSTGSSLSMDPTLTFVIPDHGQRSVKDFEPTPLTESDLEKMEMETEF